MKNFKHNFFFSASNVLFVSLAVYVLLECVFKNTTRKKFYSHYNMKSFKTLSPFWHTRSTRFHFWTKNLIHFMMSKMTEKNDKKIFFNQKNNRTICANVNYTKSFFLWICSTQTLTRRFCLFLLILSFHFFPHSLYCGRIFCQMSSFQRSPQMAFGQESFRSFIRILKDYEIYSLAL